MFACPYCRSRAEPVARDPHVQSGCPGARVGNLSGVISRRMGMRTRVVVVLFLIGSAACASDGPGLDADVNSQRNGETAVWRANPEDPPTSSAETFTALVTRLDCSSGVTGEVLEPSIVVRHDAVVVTFEVAPLPRGNYTCQGNDEVPYVVDVGEPIGVRDVVDGACLSGEAQSTSFCTDGAVRWSVKVQDS